MRITRDTKSYNFRRCGKPWIALVDFTNGAKGEFTFGEWCGQEGEDGTLYLEAEVGDIVAIGQRDHRKPRNSAPDYCIVGPDGELDDISKPDAYKHWLRNHEDANPLAKFSSDDLATELKRRETGKAMASESGLDM